jgi:hypothetical protein
MSPIHCSTQGASQRSSSLVNGLNFNNGGANLSESFDWMQSPYMLPLANSGSATTMSRSERTQVLLKVIQDALSLVADDFDDDSDDDA